MFKVYQIVGHPFDECVSKFSDGVIKDLAAAGE